MNTKKTLPTADSETPRLTLHHRFRNGFTVTFKLWRGRTTIDWNPSLPESTIPVVWREFCEWYSIVLARVLECNNQRRTVLSSKLLSDGVGNICGWCVEFANGLCIRVDIPSENFYCIGVTKNGEHLEVDGIFVEWLVEFINAFVLRASPK